MRDPDSDLRERFGRLRAEDARGAPSFRALLARAPERMHAARPTRLRPLLAVAAVVTLAVLLVRPPWGAPPSGDGPAPSLLPLDQWRAPTDFLLDTPGRELLATVPSLETGLPRVPVASPGTERSLPR